MNKPLRLGIVGCGDFLRLQEELIRQSKSLEVVAFFDPARDRAEKFAAKFPGSRVCASAEELLDDKNIDVAAIFVPPWLRKPLVCRAAQNGKHIVTTKPLASTMEDCREMERAVESAGVAAGVVYNRTGNPKAFTLRRVFDSGRFGRLTLFKQDWVHHYPQWNTWALDPKKNGGPFMDAMIHNLNAVRYLMNRAVTQGTMFSDRHSHFDLPCADTEFLKLDFVDQGAAHLFITWAADLRVDDTSGNYREHIDIWSAVTDQGWRISDEMVDGKRIMVATRHGERETIAIEPIPETSYEAMAKGIREKSDYRGTLASLAEAAEDIRIIQGTSSHIGSLVDLR
jgi:predicted dehydrogenase